MSEEPLLDVLQKINQTSFFSPNDALTQLLEESLRIFKADLVTLHLYNQDADKWQDPLVVGNWREPLGLGGPKRTTFA